MQCPKCSRKRNLQTRYTRPLWLRIILGSKLYRCYSCDVFYIKWYKIRFQIFEQFIFMK